MRNTPRRLPSLDLMRGFEAAARHLSFTRAAHELHVTQSAVSRQIKALEDDLGVPLFRRLTRRLELTQAGRALFGTVTRLLAELARETELEDGPAIRNQQVRGKIADWYVQQQGLKLTRYRTLTALSKGQTPGPESSIIKIVAAPKMQDMGAFAMELMGPAGIMKEDVPHAAGFQAQWVGGAGFRIAGGTDEILRNIVAERVLGLPQDVRVDKDVPFNKMKN